MACATCRVHPFIHSASIDTQPYTRRSCLDHDDPRILALSDLPPSHVDILRPLLLGCFGVVDADRQQLTPLGLAAAARRLLVGQP